jgi:hypothetical protein
MNNPTTTTRRHLLRLGDRPQRSMDHARPVPRDKKHAAHHICNPGLSEREKGAEIVMPSIYHRTPKVAQHWLLQTR